MRPLNISALVLSGSLAVGFASSASADDVTTAPAPSNMRQTPGLELSVANDEPRMNSETRVRTFPNRPLLITGSVLLGGAYLPALVAAGLSDRNGDDKMFIPVAGPWMTLRQGEEESGGQKALLIADGAVQGLGALMMLAGLVVPEKRTQNWLLIGQRDGLQVGPTNMRAGFGLGARGTF
jgi:hypothetical protein